MTIFSKSDQLEEETSVSKSFLLIFDYFTYFNKNIELNLPKRKKIQKDDDMSNRSYYDIIAR